MRCLLLASHGPLASAMKETLQLFCGPDDRVKALCAYIDDASMDVNGLIELWEASRVPGDEWVVVTDIFGGSVNNAFMNRLSDASIQLVAGMSLPLVLELYAKLDTLDGKGRIAELVSQVACDGVRLCSLPEESSEDEDF